MIIKRDSNDIAPVYKKDAGNDYPKILLITTEDIFKTQTSVSLTIKSFLSGWPEDRIIQIIAEDFNGRETGQIDERTFVIGHNSLIIGRYFGKTRKSETHLHNPLKGKGKKVSLKSLIRQFASALYKSLPYKIDDGLVHFITIHNPDVIYTLLTPSRVNFLTFKLSTKFRIPILPHIFDDWQNVYLKNSIVEKPFAALFYSNLNRIIGESAFTLCISEMMCREYKRIFSKGTFKPLMHSVRDLSQSQPNFVGKERVLVYSGSMYLGRDKSLLYLCEAIENHNDDIKLDLYCPKEQWNEISLAFERFPFVRFKGLVPQEELFMRIGEAFAMAFVESLDAYFLPYTKLSMSTKIPEYLSSGKPIIAIGNSSQCSIDYLKSNNAAYVVTQADDINHAYTDFLLEKNKKEIIANARSLFLANHEKSSQKNKFKQIVNMVISNSKTD